MKSPLKKKTWFENILSPGRRMSIGLLFPLSFITLLSGALSSCGDLGIIGGADGPTAIFVSKKENPLYKQLYMARLKYAGNTSGVGKILNLLPSDKIGTQKGFELETDSRPYGIIRSFSTIKQNSEDAQRQAAVILSLIENADFVRYKFSDAELSYTRKQLDEIYGTLSEYSKNAKAFEQFFTQLGFDDLSPDLTQARLLDNRIANAILEYNAGKFLPGICSGEGHIVIGAENDNKIIYALTMYGEYDFEDNDLVKISGTGVRPMKITFDDSGNTVDIQTTQDGSGYEKSLKKIFPTEYHGLLLKPELHHDILSEQEQAYAKKYLEKNGK